MENTTLALALAFITPSICLYPENYVAAQVHSLRFEEIEEVGGLVLSGVNERDRSGASVSAAGDFNADGFADLLIGAPNANSVSLGAAYLVFGADRTEHGSAVDLGRLDRIGGVTIDGAFHGSNSEVYKNAGASVANAGDVNNDGFDDALIGSRPRVGQGRAFLLFGGEVRSHASVSLDIEFPGLKLEGDAEECDAQDICSRTSGFGTSVNGVGDVNDDGISDFAVTNSFNRTYIYFGRTGLEESRSLHTSALDGSNGFAIHHDFEVPARNLFVRASAAGDMNGDGIDDLIVGNSSTNAPVGYVVFGSSNLGRGGVIDLIAENPPAGIVSLRMSQSLRPHGVEGVLSVDGAGDFNGDGFDDVILGRNDSADASYLVFGGETLSGSLDLETLDGSDGFKILESSSSGSNHNVAAAGDLNNDGFSDIVVGSSSFRVNQSYFLFGGDDVGNTGSIDLSSNGYSGFLISGFDNGTSVSGLGDFDGDGFADILIGASSIGSGSSFVVYGPLPEPDAGPMACGAAIITLALSRRRYDFRWN